VVAAEAALVVAVVVEPQAEAGTRGQVQTVAVAVVDEVLPEVVTAVGAGAGVR